MRSSMRLLSLGATAAFILTACTGGGAATTAPSAAPSAAASEAPSELRVGRPERRRGRLDRVRRVRHRRSRRQGLQRPRQEGPRGRGRPPGTRPSSAEAQGSTDYAANIQRLIDAGLPVDRHGRLPAVAGDRRSGTLANPTIAFSQVDTAWNEAGHDFTLGTADDTAASRRTSPASTTRSTRPRCSPATWPRAGARPARSAPTAAWRSRA